jgi:hypothetical protein
MRSNDRRKHPFRARRPHGRRQITRPSASRPAFFERLETRAMLTTLSLLAQDRYPSEQFGEAATYGELYRFGGDISQPLTVMLTSSDESEILVPASVTFPADETTVTFPIDTVDDTLLDGEQLVFITATAGVDSTDAALLVQDHETATVTFDQTELSPGDTLTGTITISVTANTEPVNVPLVSTRPNEIASTVAEIPVGQQTVNFEISVTSDAFAEGPHAVKIGVPWDSGFVGNEVYLSVTDPGVNTLQPVDDGHARDADRDGVVFEELTTNSTQITTQAASPTGSFGKARGILEFDVSAIPAGAVLQSAVLTVDVGGQSGTTPMAKAAPGRFSQASAVTTNLRPAAIRRLTFGRWNVSHRAAAYCPSKSGMSLTGLDNTCPSENPPARQPL